MDFGQAEGNRGYKSLFKKAKYILSGIVPKDKPGLPVVKAEANLWFAKILLVEAGKKDTKEQSDATVETGLRYIQQAFGKDYRGKYLLKGRVLSSAFATKGDLLAALKKFKEAENKLQLALKVFPNNYSALASLGDVLNWQGDHAQAIKHYQIIPAASAAYPRAHLGLIEARMREGEVYSDPSIKAMEEEAKFIFKSEAPGSPLVTRAIQSLTEAYRTNEDFQDRVIAIGENILGPYDIKTGYSLDDKDVEETRIILTPLDAKTRAALEDKFLGELYLRIAESLLWRKEFDKALAFADNIPNKLKADFEAGLKKRPELRVLHDLIKAEAKMRKDKEAAPFLAFLKLPYKPHLVAIKQKDPDLATRIVLDKIEAYSLEKKWDEAIDSGKKAAATVEDGGNIYKKLFASRKLSYENFRFAAHFGLVDAYIGNKDFDKAEEELNKILTLVKAEIPKAKDNESLLAALNRFQAKAHVGLGNIYSYYWSKQEKNGQDFVKSEKNYLEAQASINRNLAKRGELSKKGKIILAQALLGLGEIYRFATDNKIRNYDNSKDRYLEAEKVSLELPEKSFDRLELLAKIYLGLALLEQENGNPKEAWLYMYESKKLLGKVPCPPEELESGVDRATQSIFAPNIDLSWSRFSDIQAEEDRFAVTLQLPFPFWRKTMQDQLVFYAQNFTDTRLDPSGRSTLNSIYLGVRFTPTWLFKKRLTLDAKGKIASFFLTHDTSASLPQNFRRPTFRFAGSYWGKHLTTSASYDLNLEDPRLNTLYADAMLNLAFTKNRFAQLRLGGIFSDYHFTYLGDFRKRLFAGFGLSYELDFAAIFRSLSYNFLKSKIDVVLPVYEFEREAREGYMLEDKTTDRFMHNGAPFQFNGCLDLNLGKYGVPQVCAGGSIQNTSDYRYYNLKVGVGYRNSLF
jgi:hypothetical protein